MCGSHAHQAGLSTPVISTSSVRLASERPDAKRSSKYLGTVRTFLDNFVARSRCGLGLSAK